MQRPLGVTLISVWDFLGAVVLFLMAISAITTADSVLPLVLLVGALINAVLGYGMWIMENWARVAHIVFAVVGIVSAIVGYMISPTLVQLPATILVAIIYVLVVWYLMRPEIAGEFR